MARGDRPLPGLAPQLGDPGVFVCGPDDIAPWERGVSTPVPPVPVGPAVRDPANAGVGSEHQRAPVWLVLNLCPHCSPAHGGHYCAEHNARNWWLTKSGLGRSRRPDTT